MRVTFVIIVFCCLLLLAYGQEKDTSPHQFRPYSFMDVSINPQTPCPEGQFKAFNGDCIDEDSVFLFDK